MNAMPESFYEIRRTLLIQEAEKAHDILYQGKNIGKVVLTLP